MLARRADKSMTARLVESKLRGNSFDLMIVDEFFDTKGFTSMAKAKPSLSADSIRHLTELAEKMSSYFNDNEVKTDLLAPASLTVKVPGKGYKKVSHVGGETFIFDRVHIGAESKGSNLIFSLRREMGAASAGYSEMEMDEHQAQSLLDNFRSHATAAAGRNFKEAMADIRKIEHEITQVEEVKQKATDYEHYGSW